MKGMRLGGRQKGTPNKRSAEVAAIAARLKCDPFEIICLFAKGDTKALGFKPDGLGKFPALDSDLRLRAATEAARYLHAQRKAIEHTTGEEGFKIVIEDYGKPK